MEQGYQAGVRHVDHFWCAMTSAPSVAERLGWPMQASMAEFVLANDEMSTVTGMDGMVRNMTSLTRASLVEAVRMATLTPAERVGIDQEVGSLTAGRRADIVVLAPGLDVQRVFLGGVEHEPISVGSPG